MRFLYAIRAALAGLVATLALASCQKEAKLSTNISSSTSTSLAMNQSVILVAVKTTGTLASNSKDSIYIVNACPNGGKRDSVAFSSLPSAIGTYLTANYAGYTFNKAFKVYTKSGSLDSYAVIITYNGKPVGLKFDASGNFVQIFEQRERPDINNNQGWHAGGFFDNRNGQQKDTIAISDLPAAIKAYIKTNYATDTLQHAVEARDSTYIVFSLNKGLFATTFSSKFVFINRVQLYPKPAKPITVAQANLPAAILTYLTATYPGYVFDKAYSEKLGTVIDRYVVLIDANSTRYAVEFNGSGTFEKTIAIR